ncbi:TIGR03086 family metal-binding protein [Streptomyces flavofungini]|uniref:TIGR03086 family metal-binding protein n=1 Tax=Streptomyces flavofungini TaxID=68200 RepID=UPI0025B02D71|nr:TIGR03086 family metal-binding protein [Streptomyces flavofungini]WJV49548.1 TIGR03086 family metal-binding protein [Streptomyces flavofungini]
MPDDTEALLPDFGPQTQLVARLAGAVKDDQLDGPTPCPDYAVRHLLGHVVFLTLAFTEAGRKELGEITGTDPGSALPDLAEGWREALPGQLALLAEAWRDPAAWTGDTRAADVDLPGDIAGTIAMNELVLHGWDLARATGQEYAPDEAGLAVSYAMVSATAAEPPEARGNLFGPPLPVPEGASLLDQVVALSGRDPAWRP